MEEYSPILLLLTPLRMPGAETEAAAIGHRDFFALFFESAAAAAAAAEWVGEESGGIWGTFGWADAQRMGEEKLGRSVSRRISH